MNAILSWWDGVELWLTGLPFILQVVIVMPVALLLAWGLAVAGDAALGYLLRGLRVARLTYKRRMDHR
ncbi:hypothetical protein MINS_33270 [Mycolicibacterium insubricum]|jgi:hypothetical protein|uniref:Uncharacterized protein n=1 Tax=Mycolicibacterium insubricum TaxID=444597 RepID=A0A1X0DNV8_9MYCO|nr:hypothetical protein [Mycolicibacterium insubricum]MCB0928329.1 hypothetical protein [Mycobacterium sp.]MCV7082828.1 hypothetical protein [Mycolicibacterium insubricum]ORA74073.1 hypothetical protein BST26_00360 [Mycolicibacterium insubricum]BBZ67898.1 hypothetical protein MINS_33270 [Mycolicibacterium insubricum]